MIQFCNLSHGIFKLNLDTLSTGTLLERKKRMMSPRQSLRLDPEVLSIADCGLVQQSQGENVFLLVTS